MNTSTNKSGCFRKFSVFFVVSKIRARGCLIAAALLVLLAPRGARADLSIYSDSLQPDWHNWMMDGTANFSNATPVHSGSKSIAMLDSWSLLMIGRYPPMSLMGFASLDFSFHGGISARDGTYLVLIFSGPVEPSDTTTIYLPTLAPDVWHNISIPLDSPSFANRSDFQGFFIGSFGPIHAPYYVDDIRLTSVPEPSVFGLFGMGWLIAARWFKGAK